MAVEQLTPDHPLWAQLVAHLHQHHMAREVLLAPDQPLPALYVLGAVTDADVVVGHIAMRMQRLAVPLAARDETVQTLNGPCERPLREMFVRSFAVDAAHRRQGHGRALQCSALELTRRLGCYQLRSWSSLDKTANYALKLNLGFAAHPAIQHTANGKPISGVYFVKVV